MYWVVFSCIFLSVSLQAHCYLCPDNDLNCNEWKKYLVDEHNRVRQEASRELGLLTWNSTLADHALTYARKCYRNHSDYKERIRLTDSCGWIGENGWSGYGTVSGDDATRAFENEKRYWNYTLRKCNEPWKKCGHYKLVIAPKMAQLGCGRARCGDGKLIRIWCWYGRLCNDSKKREVQRLFGLSSVDQLYEFVRALNRQNHAPVPPPTGNPQPDHIPKGNELDNLVPPEDSDESSEEKEEEI